MADSAEGADGPLLDQGKLTRKDLEWAINKAYRVDVRRAARRLLQELDQLVEPLVSSMRAEMLTAQPRHGARVVLGSGYLEERQENQVWLTHRRAKSRVDAHFRNVELMPSRDSLSM